MDESKMTKVKCSVCDNEFEIAQEACQVGDIKECAVCGATLEVTSNDPLTLDGVSRDK